MGTPSPRAGPQALLPPEPGPDLTQVKGVEGPTSQSLAVCLQQQTGRAPLLHPEERWRRGDVELWFMAKNVTWSLRVWSHFNTQRTGARSYLGPLDQACYLTEHVEVKQAEKHFLGIFRNSWWP